MTSSIRDTLRRSNSSKTYGIDSTLKIFKVLFFLFGLSLLVAKRFGRECQSFIRRRMTEGDAESMEVQTSCLCLLFVLVVLACGVVDTPASVKEVAYDGAAQTERVGGVDTQLVCAASYWTE